MSHEPAFVPSHVEELPRQFANFVCERSTASEELWLGAALTSQHTLDGGVCLDLPSIAGRPWTGDDGSGGEVAPSLHRWVATLRSSSAVGRPGDLRPLILTDEGRLYLHRYWEYETALAEDLRRRASTRPRVDLDALARAWQHLALRDELAEGQRVAAVTAVLRGLTVISGGAGTGKTTIVACILKLLAAGSDPDRPLRARLVAPTGKAAGRLKEQLRAYRERLDPEGEIDRLLADEPATLHRLLGGAPGAPRYRHHADNPLPLDVLVVDETSMVDLPMMTKVVAALPSAARLVLIGDKDQLPPVGVGSVFGELCTAPPSPTPELSAEIEAVTGIAPLSSPTDDDQTRELASSITFLRHSFRFDAASGIGALADAVRRGDGRALARLVEAPPEDLAWLPRSADSARGVSAESVSGVAEGFAPFLDAVRTGAPPAEVLARLGRFRILCVLREGPSGVAGWNEAIESHLRAKRWIKGGQTWYEGRPVLVTRNDYAQRLWNGDVGVALRRGDGALRVWFEGAAGDLRDFPPGRLSHVETAYALTVHKSQGSEFEHVVLALPESETRLLSRELLYTGVTRARARLEVLGDPSRFAEGMFRRLPRASGLASALGLQREEHRTEPRPAPPTLPTAAKGPRQGELF